MDEPDKCIQISDLQAFLRFIYNRNDQGIMVRLIRSGDVTFASQYDKIRGTVYVKPKLELAMRNIVQEFEFVLVLEQHERH